MYEVFNQKVKELLNKVGFNEKFSLTNSKYDLCDFLYSNNQIEIYWNDGECDIGCIYIDDVSEPHELDSSTYLDLLEYFNLRQPEIDINDKHVFEVYIEHNYLGDIVRISCGDFKRYIKTHITNDYNIEFEIRKYEGKRQNDDSHIVKNITKKLTNAINKAKEEIIDEIDAEVKKFANESEKRQQKSKKEAIIAAIEKDPSKMEACFKII